MAFKAPKNDVYIANIGIIKAKKSHLQCPKRRAKMPIIWSFKCQNWCLKHQKRHLSLKKWTPVRKNIIYKCPLKLFTFNLDWENCDLFVNYICVTVF